MASPLQNQTLAARTSGEWEEIAEQLSKALATDKSEPRLRALVREWCQQAHRQQLAPEQFLVVIKSQFARIPALKERRDDGSRKNGDLERIVTLCIEEYFRAD
jgi:hypothetical protein